MLVMAAVPTLGTGRSWEHCLSHVSPGAGRGVGTDVGVQLPRQRPSKIGAWPHCWHQAEPQGRCPRRGRRWMNTSPTQLQ